MEELIQRIDQLIAIMNRNSVPTWITIVGIFVPILISLMLLLQAYRHHKDNTLLQKQFEQSHEKLQRELSEHEERVQMRENILKIYDDFCSAQSVIGIACGQIHIIFSYINSYNAANMPMQWVDSLNSATSSICQAVNRAKLLLPSSDDNFKRALEVIYEKYKEIRAKVYFYYNNGYAFSAAETAWNTIVLPYSIAKYNYYTLASNQPAYDAFLKLCVNDLTNEIEGMIKELILLFDYEKFDKYFEPYLQMGSVEGLDNHGSDK